MQLLPQTYERLKSGEKTVLWIPVRKGQVFCDEAVFNNERPVFVTGRQYDTNFNVSVKVLEIQRRGSLMHAQHEDAILAGFDSVQTFLELFVTKYGKKAVERPSWKIHLGLEANNDR